MSGAILILGGTREAAELARRLDRAGIAVISSLAGVTLAPAALPGRVRSGGFGGRDGLIDYLLTTGPRLLVDATHPFAETISANAVAAAAAAGIPHLRLERPPWSQGAEDRWHRVPSVAAAAGDRRLAGRVVFLTIGSADLPLFYGREDASFVARLIENPSPAPPAGWHILRARGPFRQAAEADLIRRHGIDLLVSRNSGGPMGAKLAAAAALGREVLMIDRPAPVKAAPKALPDADTAFREIQRRISMP